MAHNILDIMNDPPEDKKPGADLVALVEVTFGLGAIAGIIVGLAAMGVGALCGLSMASVLATGALFGGGAAGAAAAATICTDVYERITGRIVPAIPQPSEEDERDNTPAKTKWIAAVTSLIVCCGAAALGAVAASKVPYVRDHSPFGKVTLPAVDHQKSPANNHQKLR